MKYFIESKTLWINAIILLTTWLLNHQGIMKEAGFDADTQVMLVSLFNIVNRFFTTKAVSIRSDSNE